MTQSGYPPSPDPGSPGDPDPLAPSPSPLGDQAGWYAPWTPDPGSAPPPPPPEGQPPASGAAPDPGAALGCARRRGVPVPAGPFGSPPNAGPPGQAPYGQPPYGQPPYGPGQYGQGPYGTARARDRRPGPGPIRPGPGSLRPQGPFGYGMGYRGWRRGMYGPMAGRPAGAFLRRRAITHTLLGALLLAIGIVVTVVNLNSVPAPAGGLRLRPLVPDRDRRHLVLRRAEHARPHLEVSLSAR